MITPPLGLNVYVMKGIAPHVKLEDIFRGAVWFFVMDVVTVTILVLLPNLSLWLPDMMFVK